LRLPENLNLGGELILNVGGHISLQRSLLSFTSRLRPLFIELPLEAGEHLEELIFDEELGFVLVGPCLHATAGKE